MESQSEFLYACMHTGENFKAFLYQYQTALLYSHNFIVYRYFGIKLYKLIFPGKF